MQTFKYNNLTSVYDKGVYTLTPDEGYLLRNKETGETFKKVVTKYYTYYETIEAPADAPKPKKTRTKKQ